jgi:methanol--5-hydroxybenzimidazolylcobamide Co-methyltransferase
MLAIESTGGKEIHDEALIAADLAAIIFSLGVLASTDMRFLWSEIVKIANKYNKIPSGDTACGFANTSMILADKGLIPKVLAAVVRTATIPRSLQAYLCGAVGPSKDCAYEGPFIKTMTGVPISMEGKTSACAHLSHLGNVASAYCDLWSNESIPNIRLLSASAPVVSLELLVYDCRLMNRAIKEGKSSALKLQRWMIESDVYYDPQAYIFKPDIVLELSKKLSVIESPLEATITAIDSTLSILRNAVEKQELHLSNSELRWLNLLSAQLEAVPDNAEMLTALVESSGVYAEKIDLSEYDLVNA